MRPTNKKVAVVTGGAFNMIVTNVPASRTPIYFAGAKMLEYDACGPIWENMSLIHVVTSYLDTVNVSFDVDEDKLTAPDLYKTCLEKAAKSFLKLAKKSGVIQPPVEFSSVNGTDDLHRSRPGRRYE